MMMTASDIYGKLRAEYGQPRWWSNEPFVVMVQAILVQNTAWSSVEKVTDAMMPKLTPTYVLGLKTDELEDLIRPCGFCKGKAAAIRRLTEWYGRYAYRAERVQMLDKQALRKELLDIKGVGAETADVLLVYAFQKASFVIDTYTRRLLNRLGFAFSDDDEMRAFFETGLESDYQLYGWYHWLILEHGIQHCKKIPACEKCVFEKTCRKG